MPTQTTPETVTIDGLTFERPFRADRRYMTFGITIGSWVVSFSKADGTGGLTYPDRRVFDAFGINPGEES